MFSDHNVGEIDFNANIALTRAYINTVFKDMKTPFVGDQKVPCESITFYSIVNCFKRNRKQKHPEFRKDCVEKHKKTVDEKSNKNGIIRILLSQKH